MLLSVVIPCYNESSTIQTLISRIQKVHLPITIELVLVDDGSTDGTRTLLHQIQKSTPNVKVILHEYNRGKGAALRTGFQHARGDIILIQDADLEYDPEDYCRLLKPILGGQADVVYGSRFIGGESHRVLYFWHAIANHCLTFLSNAFTNLNLTDMEVCYKVFRREILDQIELVESRFGFEPEVTAKIARLHCRIYEVGISYYGRTYAEGKKISWKDAFRAIYVILKYGILYH